MIKFRTVRVQFLGWISEAPVSRSATYVQEKTCAGRIPPRWYLNEHPQLFNIFKGEMFLIGPRPGINFFISKSPFVIVSTGKCFGTV